MECVNGKRVLVAGGFLGIDDVEGVGGDDLLDDRFQFLHFFYF